MEPPEGFTASTTAIGPFGVVARLRQGAESRCQDQGSSGAGGAAKTLFVDHVQRLGEAPQMLDRRCAAEDPVVR